MKITYFVSFAAQRGESSQFMGNLTVDLEAKLDTEMAIRDLEVLIIEAGEFSSVIITNFIILKTEGELS